MRPFVFRAQAALDIRRTQYETAQRAVAAAEADLARAAAGVDAAVGAVAQANVRARDRFEGGQSAHELEWHRNWMVGLEREVARTRQRQEECRIALKAAAIRAQAARRALRALERLREHAWRSYEQRARREEQKALDLLGNLQFAVRHIDRKESTDG